MAGNTKGLRSLAKAAPRLARLGAGRRCIRYIAQHHRSVATQTNPILPRLTAQPD